MALGLVVGLGASELRADGGEAAAQVGPERVFVKFWTGVSRRSPLGEGLTQLTRMITTESDVWSPGPKVAPRVEWGASESRALWLCERGRISGVMLSLDALSAKIPALEAWGLPFLFSSYREVDQAWQRALPMIKKELKAHGLRYMMRVDYGFQHWGLRARGGAGLAGLKDKELYGSAAGVSAQIAEALGYRLWRKGRPEVGAQLEAEAIDGVEDGLHDARFLDWWPHLRQWVMSQHRHRAGVVLWCESWFEEAPPEIQQRLLEGKIKWGPLEATTLEVARHFEEAFAVPRMEAQGIQVLRLSATEREALVRQLAPVVEAFEAQADEAGLSLLRALRGRRSRR